MTEQEAIKCLTGILDECTSDESAVSYVTDVDEIPLRMGIAALEKRIPKEVIFVHLLQEDDCGDYMCPSCKTGTVYDAYGHKPPYCHYCGQALKWE